MLEGRALAFRYNRRAPWLFQDCHIQVAPGEVVGLPGPSGRGKSTLAKILAGLLRPQLGEVLLNGKPLPERGYCPVQLLLQHPELAVNPRWKVREILEEAGPPDPELLAGLAVVPDWLERYPHEMSGGELQRICLVRALAPGTRYLLCDEMTSMLDALTQAGIWQTVLQIATRRNLGLLVISHDRALLRQLCDRTASLFVEQELAV